MAGALLLRNREMGRRDVRESRTIGVRLLACGASALVWCISLLIPTLARGAEYKANPSNYAARVSRLKPGDTLTLAAGTYRGLTVSHLNGNSSAWIVITGPASGSPAV